MICIAPRTRPAHSCSTKSGRRARPTPSIRIRPISSAGTPAKMRSWRDETLPSGSRSSEPHQSNCSGFWSSEVVARSCANLEIFRIVSNYIHFNFMIAGDICDSRRVADRVLRVQLAANFIDSPFDGAILERGKMRAARGCRGNLQGVVLDLIVNVLHGPDSRCQNVNVAVAVRFAGGS